MARLFTFGLPVRESARVQARVQAPDLAHAYASQVGTREPCLYKSVLLDAHSRGKTRTLDLMALTTSIATAAGAFDTVDFLARLNSDVMRAFFTPEGQKDDAWRVLALELREHGNASVLVELHASGAAYWPLLAGMTYDALRVRGPKAWARFCEKVDDPRQRSDQYFKALTDLAGAWVIVRDATKLYNYVDCVRACMCAEPGAIAFSQDFGPSIARRVYAWLPGAVPVEIGVMHPYAAHVFAHDSALRDKRAAESRNEPYTGKIAAPINYWVGGAWDAVEKALLEVASVTASAESAELERTARARAALVAVGLAWPFDAEAGDDDKGNRLQAPHASQDARVATQ